MKVSVIVSIYNAEKTLARCVRSILTQSYKKMEIILVDDGSSDNSLEICKDFVNIDNRVVVINKKRGGVSSARNSGLRATTGEYVQFVDADDTLKPYMTESLVNFMLKTGADVVVCGYDRISAKSAETKSPRSSISEGGLVFRDLFVELYTDAFFNAPWNKLYRRSEIKSCFDENVSMGEDLLFNLSYFSNCDKISVVSDSLYNYDVSSQESLAGKYDENLLTTQIMLHKKTQNFFENNFNSKDFRKINGVFAKEIYYYLKKLVILSGYDKTTVQKKINACINDEDVKKALSNVALNDSQVNVVRDLMRLKFSAAIYYFFKLKSFINRNDMR